MAVSGTALADPLMTDWTSVEAVPPDKRIMVRLYRDAAPAGQRAIKGRFVSATASEISLVGLDGNQQTIAKGQVRRVAVERPTKKRARTTGILAGVGAGASLLLMVIGYWGRSDGPRTMFNFFLLSNLVITLPLSLTGWYGEPRDVIYNVPLKHRQP